MGMEKSTVDFQLHMAVKSLAVFQGEINCKVDELIKKLKALQEKEKERENTDYLLKMVSDNLEDLQELFMQRNNLWVQIEKLEKKEIQLLKD
jgi:predicted neutral ceramidase superfamily lipid hydrolase